MYAEAQVNSHCEANLKSGVAESEVGRFSQRVEVAKACSENFLSVESSKLLEEKLRFADGI